MGTNDRKQLKCKSLNNTNNLHKGHFIITVIICQAAAKPRYKYSSSFPEEKQNEQLKYSKPVQPQDKDVKEYEATSAKKPYQETPNSDRKRQRKLRRRKEKFPSMYRKKSTGEGMNPPSVTTTWAPARGTDGCCTGPRYSTITITTMNTLTNGGRKPIGGGTLTT